MKVFTNILLLVFAIAIFSGCNDVVEKFSVKVGTNTITAITDFNEDYALNLTGNFPIDIDGVNYGDIFLAAQTDDHPFYVGITANFETFTSDVWTGFAPTKKLPNGDPLPGWIEPYELVTTQLPNFDENFDVHLYVGYHNPYYVGVAVTLNIFDNHYPEGLLISQYFKKEDIPLGTVTVFGPTYDDEGNVEQHGGLFFVATFEQTRMGDIDFADELDSEIIFSGRRAGEYRNNPEKQKEALETVKRLIKKFNQSRK